jgi:hypothetical protein
MPVVPVDQLFSADSGISLLWLLALAIAVIGISSYVKSHYIDSD